MHIGQKVKELRREKKISREQLAEMAGYKSRQSIYDIESKEKPTFLVVKKMAKALGVDTNVFYEDNEVKDSIVSYNVKKDRLNYLLDEVKDIWSKMEEENIRLKEINEDLKKQLRTKSK